MAEGGEMLPSAILKVIFPLEYWDLLREHADAAESRSVSCRRAGRAGVDVSGRRPVGRQRLGTHADRARRPAAATRAGSAFRVLPRAG